MDVGTCRALTLLTSPSVCHTRSSLREFEFHSSSEPLSSAVLRERPRLHPPGWILGLHAWLEEGQPSTPCQARIKALGISLGLSCSTTGTKLVFSS